MEYSNPHSPPSEYVLDFPKTSPPYETLFNNVILTSQLVKVMVSMNNNQHFIVEEDIFVMYYEVEAWPMLHSAVKFRQNMCIYHK